MRTLGLVGAKNIKYLDGMIQAIENNQIWVKVQFLAFSLHLTPTVAFSSQQGHTQLSVCQACPVSVLFLWFKYLNLPPGVGEVRSALAVA